MITRIIGYLISKPALILACIAALGIIGYKIKGTVDGHYQLIAQNRQLEIDLADLKEQRDIDKSKYESDLRSATITNEVAQSLVGFRTDAKINLNLSFTHIDEAYRHAEANPTACGYPLHPSMQYVFNRMLEQPTSDQTNGPRSNGVSVP